MTQSLVAFLKLHLMYVCPNEKFNWYEKAGVREYWIAIPSEKVIQVYYLENGQYQLGGIYDKTPAQSVIFEGFEAVLEKVFR